MSCSIVIKETNWEVSSMYRLKAESDCISFTQNEGKGGTGKDEYVISF